MPAQNVHVIKEDFKNLQEASEAFAVLQKQFRYMQEHIDVENIIAKSLTAAVIKAGTLTADEIAANTITADKMDVDELSAITARLGKIISGEIYGTYIATNEGTYPRAEMSNTDRYFRALANASVYTEIIAGLFGAPAIHLEDGVTTGVIQTIAFFGGTLGISSTTDIDIKPGTGHKIAIPSWSQLYSIGDTQTLADALNNLATAIAGKATKGSTTGSSGAASLNGGIPIGTQLATASGGAVTWGGINISAHTHNQT